MLFLCFLLIPLCFLVPYLRYYDGADRLFGYGLYVAGAFLMSLFLYFLLTRGEKEKEGISGKRAMFFVLFLSLIDVWVKVLIFHFNIRFRILGEFLQIIPTENANYTGMFNFLGIRAGKAGAVGTRLVALFLVLYLSKFIKSRYGKAAFVLMMAAILSGMADVLFWDYTLDYVYFYRLFTYDLKDFYVGAAVSLAVMEFYEIEAAKQRRKAKREF